MTYIYTYARHEDEAALCNLELSALFGKKPDSDHYVVSEQDVPVSVNRSPFFKRRIQVSAEAAAVEQMGTVLASIDLAGKTFKVLYVEGDEQHSYEERRQLEREAGALIRGKAEMRRPEQIFGLIRIDGRWLFGPCEESDALWLKHSRKPQNYSTALPTRAARAIVNIATGPAASQVRFIDPCCGMGTVLIEALSMGVHATGMDLNPLAIRGARSNLQFFGYPNVVVRGDMRQLEGRYDAAVVDMPYNVCSVLPSDEQMEMLDSVRRLAARAVIITTTAIDRQLELAGFRIMDCAILSKASFTRFITVVE